MLFCDKCGSVGNFECKECGGTGRYKPMKPTIPKLGLPSDEQVLGHAPTRATTAADF